LHKKVKLSVRFSQVFKEECSQKHEYPIIDSSPTQKRLESLMPLAKVDGQPKFLPVSILVYRLTFGCFPLKFSAAGIDADFRPEWRLDYT